MSFEKNFCSSPWFHARITNVGTYEYCRAQHKELVRQIDFTHSIQNQSFKEFFQTSMAPLRKEFLDGGAPLVCQTCYEMEQHDKISARQRQLLKAGIRESQFAITMASSPLRDDFVYSNNNQGHTTRSIIDWQIDLGNYCNSACIFCSPHSSSRMATEFKKIGLISEMPSKAWCADPVLLEKFIADLTSSNDTRYVHFIGGETLITPAFKKIIQALVDKNLSQSITLGFTTNLTVWDDSIVDLLTKFEQVNLGASVETLTPVNDYVRWPSLCVDVKSMLDKWVTLCKKHNWLVQLRITPTCLTIHDLHTVYEYAWQHQLSVESCNFLENPSWLRISVLPYEQRQYARQRLTNWIDQHWVEPADQVVNTRHPSHCYEQIVQDAQSYVNYLDHADYTTHELSALIDYLRRLESSRGNKILDYIPEYEKFLRSAGY
jgi:organic radical activating enzyme